MSASNRVPYRVAAEHFRLAVARARDADPALPPRAWRVLVGLGELILSWSKACDHVSRSQLAHSAGLSERTVTRAMADLEGCGAITYERSETRGVMSTVHLAHAPGELSGVTELCHPNGSVGVTEPGRSGDRSEQLGRQQLSPSRVDPENYRRATPTESTAAAQTARLRANLVDGPLVDEDDLPGDWRERLDDAKRRLA